MTTLNLTFSKTLYGLVAISVVAIGVGIWRSQESIATPPAQRQEQRATSGSLVSFRPALDLGTVSMAAGNVPFQYLIKNAGEAPLDLQRISTSCMCTSATLVTANGRKGPFGMPGHGGGTNTVKARLAPGETANLQVVFDPAAHGPSGLGRIERTVTIESADAVPLELRMVVMVTP